MIILFTFAMLMIFTVICIVLYTYNSKMKKSIYTLIKELDETDDYHEVSKNYKRYSNEYGSYTQIINILNIITLVIIIIEIICFSLFSTTFLVTLGGIAYSEAGKLNGPLSEESFHSYSIFSFIYGPILIGIFSVIIINLSTKNNTNTLEGIMVLLEKKKNGSNYK